MDVIFLKLKNTIFSPFSLILWVDFKRKTNTHKNKRTVIMKKIALLLILAASTQLGIAQQSTEWCGTGDAPQENLDYIRMLRDNGVFDQLDIEQVQNTIFVPLKIFIFGNDNGQGYYRLDNLMTNIKEMNEKFKPHNIQFFLRGDIDYINNSALYNLPSKETSSTINTTYNQPRVINVYFMSLSAVSLCGFANFPNTGSPNEPLRRGAIYLSNACSGPGNTTFAHEMGHFLNLPHPFQNTSTDPLLHERVTRNPNEIAPRLSANCVNSADNFCDTEADFRGARWACPMPNTTVVDANGDLFNPVAAYYMGYANDNCQSIFTPEQVAAMRATLTVTQNQLGQNVAGPRMYLLSPPMEPYDTITSNATLVEPLNNSTGHAANWVSFKWRKVPGATMYAVRIRRNFSVIDEFVVKGDTGIIYTKNTLSANVQYRVSVLPFNHKVTDRTYGQEAFFTTTTGYGVNVREVEMNNVKIYPTLLQSHAPLQVVLGEEQTSVLKYQILDMQGRVVAQGDARGTGSQRFEIDTDGLNNGTYMLRLQADHTAKFQRFVIGR